MLSCYQAPCKQKFLTERTKAFIYEKQVQISNKQFLLHYNEDKTGWRFLIAAVFFKRTDKVSRFYTTERNHIYAIVETVGKGFKVVFSQITKGSII
jgi:hypothetical protein